MFFSVVIIIPCLFSAMADTLAQKISQYPYYLVENVIHEKEIYIATGRIIISTRRDNNYNLIEEGDSSFYLYSEDDKNWRLFHPYMISSHSESKIKGSRQLIFPKDISSLHGIFVSLVQDKNGNNRVFYSKDGEEWIDTEIYGVSLHIVHDVIIVPNFFSISTSRNGIDWKVSGYMESRRDIYSGNNIIGKENITIERINDLSKLITFNSDSMIGYYTNGEYVLTDNEKICLISKDAVSWKVAEKPKTVDCLEGFSYGNRSFVLLPSFECLEEGMKNNFSYYSADGAEWKKCTIDSANHRLTYGENLVGVEFKNLRYHKNFFITERVIQYANLPYSVGLKEDNLLFVSKKGAFWKPVNDSLKDLLISDINNETPIISKKLSSWGMRLIISSKGEVLPYLY